MDDIFDRMALECERDAELKVLSRKGICVRLYVRDLIDKTNAYEVEGSILDKVFNREKILFQLTNLDNNNELIDNEEFKKAIYDNLDKIMSCERCCLVFMSEDNKQNCCACEFEMEYLRSRESDSFDCSICNKLYFKAIGSRISCCNSSRGCLFCPSCYVKIVESAICPYCRNFLINL